MCAGVSISPEVSGIGKRKTQMLCARRGTLPGWTCQWCVCFAILVFQGKSLPNYSFVGVDQQAASRQTGDFMKTSR